MKTLSDYIRKPYYYVPPCPCCGSYVTGRYVRVWFFDPWVTEEALRHGEHVRPTYDDDYRDVAYCLNCDYEWPEIVTHRWMTLREINRQKTIRHTLDYYAVLKILKTPIKKKGWFNIF